MPEKLLAIKGPERWRMACAFFGRRYGSMWFYFDDGTAVRLRLRTIGRQNDYYFITAEPVDDDGSLYVLKYSPRWQSGYGRCYVAEELGNLPSTFVYPEDYWALALEKQ